MNHQVETDIRFCSPRIPIPRKSVLGSSPWKPAQVISSSNQRQETYQIHKILTNILPLFGHSLEQWSVRLEQGPEFEQLCFMTQVCVIKTFRPES